MYNYIPSAGTVLRRFMIPIFAVALIAPASLLLATGTLVPEI